jgi:hypothetical protein
MMTWDTRILIFTFQMMLATASTCTRSPCCSDDYNSDCRVALSDGFYCYCDGECQNWGDCCEDRDSVCSLSQQATTKPPPGIEFLPRV